MKYSSYLLVWLVALLLLNGAAQSIKAPQLNLPNGLAFNAQGELFISDIGAHCIFKRNRTGKLTVIAGTGMPGFSGDGGLASQAQLHAPHDILFDAAGNLLIADTGNQRIRRIDRNGMITTIAGDGKALQSNYNGTAPATSLNNPQSIALDKSGNLLIADTFNHVIRQLSPNGQLTVFAGSVGGYGGDGGPATQAQMSLPMAVTVAPDGNVLISDAGSSRIRLVTPDGKIKTIAGFGPAADTYGGGFAGDGGPPDKAKLFAATDLKCNAAGDVVISDNGNQRLRIIRNGIITTLAGTGEAGFSGDSGMATVAKLAAPQKVAIAKDGTIYFTDRANHAVRAISPTGKITTLARGTSEP